MHANPREWSLALKLPFLAKRSTGTSTGHGQPLLQTSPVRTGDKFWGEVTGVSGRGKIERKKNQEDSEGSGEEGTNQEAEGTGPNGRGSIGDHWLSGMRCGR